MGCFDYFSAFSKNQQLEYTDLLILHFWIKSIHELWRRSHCGLGIQVFFYLTANKAHHRFKVCATTKFSSGENWKLNKGKFRHFWPYTEIFTINLAVLLEKVVCRCHKGERHLRWAVILCRRICGSCEDLRGVAATGILSGHLARLIASLPCQITLLAKHSDLNSWHPLRGRKKRFNWYTASQSLWM